MATVSYFILIARTTGGYAASSPSFPQLVGYGRGARIAYARLKVLIKQKMVQSLTDHQPLPREVVCQTKTLRVDLSYLLHEEDLR